MVAVSFRGDSERSRGLSGLLLCNCRHHSAALEYANNCRFVCFLSSGLRQQQQALRAEEKRKLEQETCASFSLSRSGSASSVPHPSIAEEEEKQKAAMTGSANTASTAVGQPSISSSPAPSTPPPPPITDALELGELVARELLRASKRHSIQHALLASLPSTEVITTNYDQLFEQARAAAGNPV